MYTVLKKKVAIDAIRPDELSVKKQKHTS
jgi:hypothetical protein